jgi:hypothetical protein
MKPIMEEAIVPDFDDGDSYSGGSQGQDGSDRKPKEDVVDATSISDRFESAVYYLLDLLKSALNSTWKAELDH